MWPPMNLALLVVWTSDSSRVLDVPQVIILTMCQMESKIKEGKKREKIFFKKKTPLLPSLKKILFPFFWMGRAATRLCKWSCPKHSWINYQEDFFKRCALFSNGVTYVCKLCTTLLPLWGGESRERRNCFQLSSSLGIKTCLGQGELADPWGFFQQGDFHGIDFWEWLEVRISMGGSPVN